MDQDQQEKKDSKSIELLLHQKFLKQRYLFLWGEIDMESAQKATQRLLFLELEAPGKPITFYINTPGGSITAGMAIYDTMKLISSLITVVVTGLAASMGSILLCAPQKGRRLLYPNARVLIHQPLIAGRIVAPAVDIQIQAQEMERTRAEMNAILSKASGQPIEKIQKDSDRDFYMNAQEAIKYGLADAIVDKAIF